MSEPPNKNKRSKKDRQIQIGFCPRAEEVVERVIFGLIFEQMNNQRA